MTVWRGSKPLILASQSAARQALLRNAGLAFEAIPAAIDERGIQDNSGLTDPGAIAALLAGEKAKSISKAHPDRFVVGADQTLALGTRLFSKPADRNAAADQLRLMSGQIHTLNSAVTVAKGGKVLFSNVAVARMTMHRLNDRAIAAYLDLAGDRVTLSVGAYQLEGAGVHLFERIDGDYFTILGLPLLPLLAFLRDHDLLTV
ncbi:Maf family nucleotide pyrophosphatase [Afipia sp. TerB]